MIKSGWSVNAARKTALLVCACCVIPIVFAAHVSGIWSAAALVGIAMAAHQGFSSNLYTLVSDMFPRRVCASVAGSGRNIWLSRGFSVLRFLRGTCFNWASGLHRTFRYRWISLSDEFCGNPDSCPSPPAGVGGRPACQRISGPILPAGGIVKAVAGEEQTKKEKGA